MKTTTFVRLANSCFFTILSSVKTKKRFTNKIRSDCFRKGSRKIEPSWSLINVSTVYPGYSYYVLQSSITNSNDFFHISSPRDNNKDFTFNGSRAFVANCRLLKRCTFKSIYSQDSYHGAF